MSGCSNVAIFINTIDSKCYITSVNIVIEWDEIFSVEQECPRWNFVSIVVISWVVNDVCCVVLNSSVVKLHTVFNSVSILIWIDVWFINRPYTNNLFAIFFNAKNECSITIVNSNSINNITAVWTKNISIDWWWINIFFSKYWKCVIIINTFVSDSNTSWNITIIVIFCPVCYTWIEDNFILNVSECCINLNIVIFKAGFKPQNITIIIVGCFCVMTHIKNVI